MNERIRPWLRVVGTALLIGAYATLAHLSNTSSAPRSVGALVAAAPPFVIATALAWRATRRALALASLAAVAVLLVILWPLLRQHYSAVMLSEQVSTWALLCASFARTLLPDRVPLCTVWADRVHGPLTQDIARYTRAVTGAWAIFFALAAVASAGLYFFGSVRIWSLFENFVVLPLIATVFVVEYLVRRVMLPQLRDVGILEAVRAYSSYR